MEAPHEIRLRLAQRLWRKRIFENGGRTDDGACLYCKLTNDSKSSGELKMFETLNFNENIENKCQNYPKTLSYYTS